MELSEEEIDIIFNKIDSSGDGSVHYQVTRSSLTMANPEGAGIYGISEAGGLSDQGEAGRHCFG